MLNPAQLNIARGLATKFVAALVLTSLFARIRHQELQGYHFYAFASTNLIEMDIVKSPRRCIDRSQSSPYKPNSQHYTPKGTRVFTLLDENYSFWLVAQTTSVPERTIRSRRDNLILRYSQEIHKCGFEANSLNSTPIQYGDFP